MFVQTIRSKDKSLTHHGIILQWLSNDEFVFVPQSKRVSEAWWCKTDFWNVYQGNLTPIGRFII